MRITRILCVLLAIMLVFTLIPGFSNYSVASPINSGTISFENGNLAYNPAATIEASYSNPYNNGGGTDADQVRRIINGYLPTGTAGEQAWNCWSAPAGAVTVTLTWPTPQLIGSTRVLWWYDTEGTPLPTGCTLQYHDGAGFVNVAPIGIRGDGTAGSNRWWQGTDFEPVSTTQLRLIVSRNNGAGIGCWEVFGVTDPEEHLLIKYDFDGNANDSSGHGFDGMVMGTSGVGYEWVIDPYFDSPVLNLKGGAYNSPDAGYVRLPNDSLEAAKNTGMTISTWYKTDFWETYSRLWDFGQNTTNFFILASSYPDGGASVRISRTGAGEANGQSISVPLPVDNAWHNVVTVLDTAAQEIRLYVDGVLKSTEGDVRLALRDILGTGAQNILCIGKSLYPDPFLNAKVRNFRIYNMALSQNYISELYQSDLKPIVAVAPVTVTTKFGVLPTLTKTVEVTYEDGSKGTTGVTWQSIDINQCYTASSFYVSGTVTGTGFPVQATVNVEPTQSLTNRYGIVLKAICDMREPSRFSASYIIGNYSDDIGKVTVVAAIYDSEGNMRAIESTPLTLAKGTYTSGSLSVALQSEFDPNDAVMKAFVLDSETLELLTDEVLCYYKLFSPVDDVRLTDGIFRTSQGVGESFLLGFDIDRLIAPFYNRAAEQTGQPSMAKAPVYGGWEAHGNVAGHSLGHWLSAASLMYRQTGNPILLERIDYAVSELAVVQDDEGYLGGQVTRGQFENFIRGSASYWAPWYVLHKLYQGLIDAYTLTGNRLAFETVLKYSDWAAGQLRQRSRAQLQSMLATEYGGIGDSIAQVYRLAVDAGIPDADKYLELAIDFDRDWLYNPLADGLNNLNNIHANTQIPAVIGAAQLYEITGDDYYRRVSENFWNIVTNNYSYADGGNSEAELFKVNEILSNTTTETCNSFNMLKLTEHLFDWNRDVKYANYYEMVLYNHILASQNPQNGGKTYYVPLVPLGSRTFTTAGFECCMGTGMENPARYSKFIYYRDARDLYVNLFIPSTLNWAETGMSLIQETNFPYSDTAKLTVVAGADNVDIHIRVPDWVAGPVIVAVNGEVAGSQQETGYISLSGNWKAGDIIEVKLPMDLHLYTSRFIPSVGGYEYNSLGYAVFYGPILLVGDFRNQNLETADYYLIEASSRNPDDWMLRVSDTDLLFEMSPETSSGNVKRSFVPFYDIISRYSVYWKLTIIDDRASIEGAAAALFDNKNAEEIILKSVLNSPDPGATFEWSFDNSNFAVIGGQNTARLKLKPIARGNTVVTCKVTLSDGEVITVYKGLKAGTIAMLAKVSTSYVSPWETLEAVNDGIEPTLGSHQREAKANGSGYGNWNDPSETQWLQYVFDRNYTIDSTGVWWWSDSNDPFALVETDHLRFPSYWLCEYLDAADNVWKPVTPSSSPAYPIIDGNYSTCVFEPITASGIRITFARRPECWTGALQWCVGGEPYKTGYVFDAWTEGGGFLTSLTNDTTTNIEGMFILAVYNEKGALVRTQSAQFSAEPGSMAECLFTNISTYDVLAGYTVKAFCWDNDYIPLTEAITLNS